MERPPARGARVSGLRVLSRRDMLVGTVAAVGLAACDDGGAKAEDTAVLGDPLLPITPNDDFYVTSCCGTPEVDGARWTLSVRDGDKLLATIDLAYLDSLPARDREHTLECIGANAYNLAMSNAVWTGLPLAEILTDLGVTVPDDAVEIVFTSADDYTTSLPVADLDRPVWLVWRMNGVPLPAEHGYPARLLVPGRYGMKNPKWVTALAFSTEAHLGYWESYGWSNAATYKPNTLVASPGRSSTIAAGPARVLGKAFAGSDPVVAVHVRITGPSGTGEWQAATLDYAPGADIWALWHFDWEALTGDHTVQARCTTASGAMSLDDSEGSDGLDGYDGSMAVSVEVV